MQVAKPAGRAASSQKYDILSGMMAYALSQDKHRQRLVMRLLVLITTRYNWQRDELSMGHAEIARLWSVDERTAKRDMAKLRALGWVAVKRQGARGRVSVYGLDLGHMMAASKPAWPNIGPDFIARMEPQAAAPAADNVVPLRAVAAPEAGQGAWAAAQAILYAQNAVTYGAWFQALSECGREDGQIVLTAPTRFHATYIKTHLAPQLDAALRQADPTISGFRIEV